MFFIDFSYYNFNMLQCHAVPGIVSFENFSPVKTIFIFWILHLKVLNVSLPFNSTKGDYYIILYYIILYYIALYYIMLYYIILYYIISDYIIWYYINIRLYYK